MVMVKGKYFKWYHK